MNKLMYKNLINLLVIIFLVSSINAVNIKVLDEGTFEELPEDRKQKTKKIIKDFGDDVSYVVLSKKHKGKMSINFGDRYQIRHKIKNYNKFKNKHFKSYFINTESIKIDDSDSNSIIKALNKYEKNGLNLIEKAGYLKHKGYSLKLDKKWLRRYGPLSEKKVFEDGQLLFKEFYNGIEILHGRSSITYLNGVISCITLHVCANQDLRISGTKPEITSNVAIQRYLSLSKNMPLIEKLTAKLCYISSRNESLLLCWKIKINNDNPRTVYLNALTGKTEYEEKNYNN